MKIYKVLAAIAAIFSLACGSLPLQGQSLLEKLKKNVGEALQSPAGKEADKEKGADKAADDVLEPNETKAEGHAGAGESAKNASLRPRFTEQSKKIVIPKEASVFPEIHAGLIAVCKYPQMLYVKADSCEYIWGLDFNFTRGKDANSPYFSGGAMMGWRTTQNGFVPFIVYPDGKYRDFPTGTKNASGMSNDITAASSFVDGYAIVMRGTVFSATQSFIDKDGKAAFPQLSSKVASTFGDMTVYPVHENRRVYYNAELKKYGYADAKGAIAIKPQFDKALNFSEGMAAVMNKDGYTEKWGFIDTTGKLVIPATYRLRPGRFSEGMAAVRIGESTSSYEMSYIDKTGKRLMDTKKLDLNEFHDGFAWVGTGCDKLFVMDKEFNEVRDVTKDFYHSGNGFGTCMFSMLSGDVQDKVWGIDFPDGMQMLNQDGLKAGDIFAPDGTVLFSCVDSDGRRANLHYPTEGGLMFCQVRFKNEPRLKEKDVYLQCFINKQGEVVYFFEEGVEGYEGKQPTLVK